MSPEFWANYFTRLAIVALVLFALYVLGRKLRAMRLFNDASRRLSVVESLVLSPQAALHLVRAGSRYFLVGSGSAGVTRLADVTRAVLRHEPRRGSAQDDAATAKR